MADSSEPPVRSGFITSEFATNAAKQVVALAGLVFVIEKLDPATTGGTAGIVAAFIAWLGSSSIDIASFTKSRTEIKTGALAAMPQILETKIDKVPEKTAVAVVEKLKDA